MKTADATSARKPRYIVVGGFLGAGKCGIQSQERALRRIELMKDRVESIYTHIIVHAEAS